MGGACSTTCPQHTHSPLHPPPYLPTYLTPNILPPQSPLLPPPLHPFISPTPPPNTNMLGRQFHATCGSLVAASLCSVPHPSLYKLPTNGEILTPVSL